MNNEYNREFSLSTIVEENLRLRNLPCYPELSVNLQEQIYKDIFHGLASAFGMILAQPRYSVTEEPGDNTVELHKETTYDLHPALRFTVKSTHKISHERSSGISLERATASEIIRYNKRYLKHAFSKYKKDNYSELPQALQLKDIAIGVRSRAERVDEFQALYGAITHLMNTAVNRAFNELYERIIIFESALQISDEYRLKGFGPDDKHLVECIGRDDKHLVECIGRDEKKLDAYAHKYGDALKKS
ncbi:hypothetical protein JW711_03490 [Candidatus Woesearchaeota archaeon]|nr:hypothetical protein [Candidatus Woesearchaeota archaeon]